jgi:hypothetical protein
MESARRLWPFASMVLGTVVLVGTGVALLGWWSAVLARVVSITVPTDGPVRVTLPRPGEMAVWRELAGPHVTVNNPVVEAPDDLQIVVTDADGSAVTVRPYRWYVEQNLLGLHRERRAVAAFDPPTREVEIELRTERLARPQVYSIGPVHDRLWRRARVPAFAGLGLGVVLLIGGTAELLRRRQAAAMSGAGGFDA